MGFNPVYQAASAGFPAQAGSINQFLGSHLAQFVYAGGSIQDQRATGTGIYNPSYTQWYSQLFTTGVNQTDIGSVNLQVSDVGGSPTLQLIPPLVVAIYADAAGQPTGAPLVSVTLACTYVYAAPFWVSIPLPLSVTPSTFYHIVTQVVGSSSHYYTLQESTAGFGASTSPDGVTWTSQSYGLMYQVTDDTGTGPLLFIYEDNGAHWFQVGYNSQGLPASATSYTVAQAPAGFLQSLHVLTYTNGFLTGVS